MRLLPFLLILITTLITRSYSYAQSNVPLKLTEDIISDLLGQMPPTLIRAEIDGLNKESAKLTFSENFGINLAASASKLSSSEKSLSAVAPATSSISSYKVGVAKNFRRGFGVELSAYRDQYTNTMLTDATTTGLSMQLSMDLYKDLMGRLTSARWNSLVFNKKRSELEEQIITAGFAIKVRKLYWSLVANSEAAILVKSLIEASKRQVTLAQQRFKERVADYGEVARYKSQLAARKARLIYLNYQKERATQVLKEILPGLSQRQVELGPYNLNQTVTQFLVCTNKIKEYQTVPLENTLYDEIVSLVNQRTAEAELINRSYDLPEIKLQLAAGTMGKALGGSESFDHFKDKSRGSISGAVMLSIPLGKEKQDSRKIQKLIIQKSREVAAKESLSKVNAFHTQIVESIDLLRQVIANQRDNSKYLSESIKVSKKKYSQARITVEQLVSEEDSLLSSQLNEIDTKLEVINTLLDYFTVFTQTPCVMNRKKI
jgi:outer membrane protein TolC